MKYINSKKVDNIKLTKENFYILIDFDRTLTKGNCIIQAYWEMNLLKNMMKYMISIWKHGSIGLKHIWIYCMKRI